MIGCRPYEFIARRHGKPVVCAGFEPLDILQAIQMIVAQLDERRCQVENEYGRVVPWGGNRSALGGAAGPGAGAHGVRGHRIIDVLVGDPLPSIC